MKMKTIGVFVLHFLLMGCDNPQNTEPMKLPLVKVITAGPSVPSQEVSWSGRLIPSMEVSLNPHRSGKLVKVLGDVGTIVHKGDVVAQLESVMSNAEVTSLREELNISDFQLSKAKLEAIRVRELVKIGSASQSMFQEAMLSLNIAEAQNRRAKENIDDLSKTSESNLIRAPFDGIITEIYAKPSQHILSEQPILKLASYKDYKIIMDLPSDIVGNLNLGSPVLIELKNGKKITANIFSISPQIDRQTSLVKVKLSVDNKYINKPLGSILVGSIILDNSKIHYIPASALTSSEGVNSIYVVSKKDHQIELHHVSVKYFTSDTVAVSAGILDDDKIITAGISKLIVGMKVAMQEKN